MSIKAVSIGPAAKSGKGPQGGLVNQLWTFGRPGRTVPQSISTAT